MVDWMSMDELVKDTSKGSVPRRCVRLELTVTRRRCLWQAHAHAPWSLHVSLRLYKYLEIAADAPLSWEFVTSLDFDWDFVVGRKKFRWPMVRHPLRDAIIWWLLASPRQHQPTCSHDFRQTRVPATTRS